MNLSYGRPYLAIPGPSVMPDRVLAAMHRASPNIYGGSLHDMVETIWPDLKNVAGTAANVALYIGNGHASWEAANANLFSRGDKALVLATGNFGHGWARSVRAMGVEVDVLDFGTASSVDPGQFEAALRADGAHKLRAVLVTQVDTASTIKNDIAALRRVMDLVGHPALLAVDCIASLGCDEYRMDAWGVDVTVAASQKGLMTPPGLGFVWFSQKAVIGRLVGFRHAQTSAQSDACFLFGPIAQPGGVRCPKPGRRHRMPAQSRVGHVQGNV